MASKFILFHTLSNTSNIDITSCKVKYDEGFVQILGHIVTKPEFLWTQADRDLITPTGNK